METKEIVHSLRCCISAESCDSCDFFGIQQCVLSLKKIAANRLEELEAEIAELKKHLSEKPEWVSVEDEQKPKEEDLVFIYPICGTTAIFFYYAKKGFPPFVTHWMKYVPPKPKAPTFKDKFLEAFPKAKMTGSEPSICRYAVFGGDILCDGKFCGYCWNQPYEEGR